MLLSVFINYYAYNMDISKTFLIVQNIKKKKTVKNKFSVNVHTIFIFVYILCT